MRKGIILLCMAGCLTVLSACSVTVHPRADVESLEVSEEALETEEAVSPETEQTSEASQEAEEDLTYSADNEELQEILDQYGITVDTLLADYDPVDDPYTWEDHTYEIEKKSLPIYYEEPSDKGEIELYFMDNEAGIPYISGKDVPALIDKCVGEDAEGYKLFAIEDGSRTFIIRETMYSVMFDFKEDIISFQDFDAYIVPSSKATLIDVIGDTGRFSEEGEEELLRINKESSYNRYGHSITINTRDYGIDLIEQDGNHYIPLQVVSDFLMAHGLQKGVLFNGGTAFVVSGGNVNPLLGVLAEGGSEGPSEALNQFSYNALCMALDSFYGLKEQHGITSFKDFFAETGLKYMFLNNDSRVISDQALYDLLKIHLDDLHSDLKCMTFWGDPAELNMYNGASYTNLMNELVKYNESRSKYYPEGVPCYEEVGDTAFITFDNFTFDNEKDYYTETPDENATDTISIIRYSLSQIKREDSPIKNVVLDLSQNVGGAVNSAAYTIGAFLGSGNICLKDTLSGAVVRQSFEADTNFDHIFDENDSLKGYNLYCLISPSSFSSGNLVPGALKASNQVSLLGKTSGGGSCTVMFLTTAKGNVFQLSSPFQLSFSKNGSFYDIDQGIEPDFSIINPDLFYDREYINDYIHELLGEE
ncbi:MAG: hypothetical protein K5770_12460 [Lachnospiraceae bacterium]|nr:hypothetical protein [Lachnospiraceae bacterium]